MNICAMRDADAARKKLVALIEELRVKLLQDQTKLGTPAARQWQRLEQNQRSWEQLSQKDCEWESAFFDGGSMQPMVESLCIMRQTKERIDRLRVFLCEAYSGECLRSQAYRDK